MKILNKLTLKHLYMNKKRTLVTIIGIALSCALMVGIGLLVSSLLETERKEAIKSNGSYHAYIEDLNKKEIEIIKSNIKVANAYEISPLGFAKINTNMPSKPYLYINEASSYFLNTLQLKEGVLPKNDKEIVISEYIDSYNSNNLKIGDTITLDIGSRISEEGELDILHNYQIAIKWEDNEAIYLPEELKVKTTKTYKIVGIFKRNPYDTGGAGILAFSSLDSPKESYNLYVEYKNPRKSYDITEEILRNNELDDKITSMNDSLLFYYGATKYNNINDTMVPLITIALFVIGIGCTIVIYNSFAISTMERKKSFGLFSSIGATNKQLKKTVLFEAFFVGVIGTIIGVLGGFLGIYVVIKILNVLLRDTFKMDLIFSVNALYLMIPLIIMFIVILVSAYIPALRASRISPIEAIRGASDIKLSKKKLKTPKIFSKIFGVEGDIAYKNMKRNKKKYRITIISLFISIVMFNTFTSYLDYMLKGVDSINQTDFDIGVYLSHDNIENIKSDIKLIKEKYDIEKFTTVYDSSSILVHNLKDADYTEEYQNYYYDTFKEKLNDASYQLIVLEDSEFLKYTKSNGIILNTKYLTTYTEDSRKTSQVKTFNKSNINLEFEFQNEEYKISNVEVIDDNLFGLKLYMSHPNPILIIPYSLYKNYEKTDRYDAAIFMNTKEYMKMKSDIDDKKISLSSFYTVNSPAIEEVQTRNMALAIKLLFYGFLTLVALIGVTSVLNTINTSMNLRRKEFAMLRSIGLSRSGFNKMLFFESMLFGFKSLLYGIPVSLALNALICLNFTNVMDAGFIINIKSMILCIIGVFLIVLLAMFYSTYRIKRENILEALREENI